MTKHKVPIINGANVRKIVVCRHAAFCEEPLETAHPLTGFLRLLNAVRLWVGSRHWVASGRSCQIAKRRQPFD